MVWTNNIFWSISGEIVETPWITPAKLVETPVINVGGIKLSWAWFINCKPLVIYVRTLTRAGWISAWNETEDAKC